MTNLAPPPNVEALLRRFLAEQPEVEDITGEDANGGGRVYTALPKGVQFPCVRVTLLDSRPHTGPAWGAAYEAQVEAFGGSKADAFRLAGICMATMSARLTGVHDEGVVNGVTSSGLRDEPDEGHEPAKPRFLFSSTIFARPLANLPAS